MAAEEFDIQKRYEKKKEEERKKEKGIVEDKKKVVQIIKLQLSPGAARPGPPIGPVLGQHQINTNDFCKEFNKLTEKMDPKLVLSVLVFKKADRSFDIKLKGPTTNFYKQKFVKESTPTAGGRFKSGELLFKVVSPKVFDRSVGNADSALEPGFPGRRVFKGVKTVLGTLRSSKVRAS